MKKLILGCLLILSVVLIGCEKNSNSIDVKCRWVIYNTGQFNQNNSEIRVQKIEPCIWRDNPSNPEVYEEIWWTTFEDTTFNQGSVSYNVFPPISDPLIVEHQLNIPSADIDLYLMGHYEEGSVEGWNTSSWWTDHEDYFYEKNYIEQNNQRIYTDTIIIGL